MNAVICTKLGNPLNNTNSGPLKFISNYKRPEIQSNSVRIQVKSTCLNFADSLIIQGLYQVKPKLPFIPGSEIYGIITELGPNVTEFNIGDKVIAISQNGGGLSEECVINTNFVFKIPNWCNESISLSGLIIAYGTSYLSLITKSKIKPKDTVLILGAAGGVGLAAIQICKIIGCKIIAFARGKEKEKILKKLKVDIIINTEVILDNNELIKEIKSNGGVDVILDTVGGDTFNKIALKCIKWEGRIAIVGFASGKFSEIPSNIILLKNLNIYGIYLGDYFKHDLKTIHDAIHQLIKWIEEDKLYVYVSHMFYFKDCHKAFNTLLSRKAIGKIILTLEQPSKL